MEKGNSDKRQPDEYEGPSWSTIRGNYWREQANKPDALERWGQDNVDRMGQGKPPINKDGKTIDLHHPEGRKGDNINKFEEMPADKHRDFHNENGYHYDEINGWH
jgi:hypothetical protein